MAMREQTCKARWNARNGNESDLMMEPYHNKFMVMYMYRWSVIHRWLLVFNAIKQTNAHRQRNQTDFHDEL